MQAFECVCVCVRVCCEFSVDGFFKKKREKAAHDDDERKKERGGGKRAAIDIE